jgi:putative transposase
MCDSRRQHREAMICQRKPWEQQIQHQQDYKAYIDCMHFNPVKDDVATHVPDWPYLIYRRFVRLGVNPENWGAASVLLSLLENVPAHRLSYLFTAF